MTTVVLNPDFEALLDGLRDTRLPGLSLDFEDLLDNFSIKEDLLIDDPTLSATGLTARFESLDPSDPTPYTFTISGSGITPSGSLEQLEAAIDASTANGTLNQIRIDYGTQTIAQLDIAPGSLTLTSGAQSLQLTGGFPITLSEIFNIIDIVDGDGEGSLAQYGFTGFTLRDGGEVLASLSTDDDTLTLNLDGFTLTATDADIRIEDVESFLFPGRAQIVPQIDLFDSSGQLVTEDVLPAISPFGSSGPNESTIAFTVPEAGGTFYVQVRASDEDIAVWQRDTGLYQLTSSFWGFTPDANQWTFEGADAPDNISTPYVLNSGASFLGAVDFVGDADWIRITLPEPINDFGFPNYFADFITVDGTFIGSAAGVVVLSAFGTGQPAPVLRDLQGISFSGLTITTPDGTEVVSATEVESFGAFIDALDAALRALRPDLPDIGGLGLAFASGDPHMLTHDGLGYDFHAAGEYVLMRATNGAPFELQARMEPAGENVTANTAAGLRVGDDLIMISSSGPALRINGTDTALADGDTVTLVDAVIARDGNSYRVSVADPQGENSLVQVDVFNSRVDIGVGLTDFWRGNVEGLLGNFSGTIQDDLRVAGTGQAVSIPLQYGDTDGNIGLYGAFRESWRVTEDSTLFTYQDGFGPDSYYLPDYPGQMITLADFSGDALAAAQAAAEEAGLVVGSFAFNNAVLDLLITGDDSFLESAVNAQNALNEAGAPSDAIHMPEVEQGSGILDQLLSIGGAVSSIYGQALDNTTVTFTRAGSAVALTRETREGDSFSFRLSEGATGRLEASRDWDPGAGDPTVTAGDALEVLRMAVGLTPSFGAAKAQNFVAADINGDGAVTAADALEVLRAAVGLNSDHAPRWVFFDAATDWDALGADRTAVNAPATGIDLMAATDLTPLGLQGILLGQMAEV